MSNGCSYNPRTGEYVNATGAPDRAVVIRQVMSREMIDYLRRTYMGKPEPVREHRRVAPFITPRPVVEPGERRKAERSPKLAVQPTRMLTITCLDCGLTFTRTPQAGCHTKRCPVCQKRFHNARPRAHGGHARRSMERAAHMVTERACAICGAMMTLTPQGQTRKYCSMPCTDEAERRQARGRREQKS